MDERKERRNGRRDFRDQREERRELAEDMIEGRLWRCFLMQSQQVLVTVR